jgi:hypothetical protein
MTNRPSDGGRRAQARRGVSLLEGLLAVLLTLFLVGLLATMAARHRTATGTLTRRAEVMEARRVARDLIGLGIAGGGVASPGAGQELWLRVFVGTGAPCGKGDWWYRGRRLPDPQRDSAWVVSAGGEVDALPVLSVGTGECGTDGSGQAVRLGLEAAGRGAVLIRVFERGRYRVGDAVRYGRTGSSAQPLTGAVLDPSGSSLAGDGDQVRLTVRGRGDSASVQRRWIVR